MGLKKGLSVAISIVSAFNYSDFIVGFVVVSIRPCRTVEADEVIIICIGLEFYHNGASGRVFVVLAYANHFSVPLVSVSTPLT